MVKNWRLAHVTSKKIIMKIVTMKIATIKIWKLTPKNSMPLIQES